ncbi:MAG: acyltransferase [Sulfuricurvum sp.]|nr:acyltransferase [Sulfuricurvum sp.]
MIKKKILEWIILHLKNSRLFNDFIDHKMRQFYKKETLQIYRVWGDEEKIVLGKSVHINDALINTTCGTVTIGEYTFFGHGVSLLTGTHDVYQRDLARQTSVPNDGRDIKIGRGVWIASNALILGPCEIGDNAVIGAGSIATGTIEANTFYAGIPAKIVKKLME